MVRAHKRIAIGLRASASWKPAFEHRPPDQGEEEDCDSLDGVCDDTADEYDAAEDAENDGVEGPRPVRAMERVFAAPEDEDSEGGEEEEEVLGYAYLSFNFIRSSLPCLS